MRIYNTLHKQKEEFIPVEKGKVGMYVCGPTTYNYIHLGNARPIVIFDTVRRFFQYRGYDVTYVQNFTDVDDKIINRAAEEKSTALQVANKYIAAYFEDVERLKVLKADVHPRVTEHMPDIIGMIEQIIAQGHAYVVGGDVYFDVRSLPTYGELSGRELDDMQAGARVEVDEIKKDPMDFALWKTAKPGEPFWDSPWGQGRPGWHIECSVMSAKYLGTTFDIHGGGADLIFPHHENEIAQSKAACTCDFAHYWMHNGFITVNQEKMSKSVGNFFLLRDILAKFSGEVVRFYLLSTHYRSPIDFADDKLQVAAKSLERITTSWQLLQEAKKRAVSDSADADLMQLIQTSRQVFIDAMEDDFNTALAISSIFDFCHGLNRYLGASSVTALSLGAAEQLFQEFDQVLGMIIPAQTTAVGLEEQLLDLILAIRQNAREKKDWGTSDLIRDGLKALGIGIDDTPQGACPKKL